MDGTHFPVDLGRARPGFAPLLGAALFRFPPTGLEGGYEPEAISLLLLLVLAINSGGAEATRKKRRGDKRYEAGEEASVGMR